MNILTGTAPARSTLRCWSATSTGQVHRTTFLPCTDGRVMVVSDDLASFSYRRMARAEAVAFWRRLRAAGDEPVETDINGVGLDEFNRFINIY